MAIQLHCPSGRPHGILNISLGFMDSTMQSMSFYRELSFSTVGSIMNGSKVSTVQKNGNVNESFYSDVGPSPSVVTVTIAKGIYLLPYNGSHCLTNGPTKTKWKG
ncbi:hypothetical protein ACFX13_042124 [Malus domestica]